jgi:hypothetical protein
MYKTDDVSVPYPQNPVHRSVGVDYRISAFLVRDGPYEEDAAGSSSLLALYEILVLNLGKSLCRRRKRHDGRFEDIFQDIYDWCVLSRSLNLHGAHSACQAIQAPLHASRNILRTPSHRRRGRPSHQIIRPVRLGKEELRRRRPERYPWKRFRGSGYDHFGRDDSRE